MNNNKGFTLIELLIVIAIIAILIGVVFVALDPLTRFRDSRDSRRFQDIVALATAIKVNQVDKKGIYRDEIKNRGTSVMMIGTATTLCTSGTCTGSPPASAGACIDLSLLVASGYMSAIPINPVGVSTYSWDASRTGYTFKRNTNGTITIQSCEAENTSVIKTIQ